MSLERKESKIFDIEDLGKSKTITQILTPEQLNDKSFEAYSKSIDAEDDSSKNYSDEMFDNDIDLAKIHGDCWKQLKEDNPYYKHEAFENKIDDINKPTEPIYKGFESVDKIKLKAYTLDMLDMIDKKNSTKEQYSFDELNRTMGRKHKVIYNKNDIYYMYTKICHEKNEPICNTIRGFLQINGFRSHSGVNVYAIFTHPMWKLNNKGEYENFSCKHNCRYCPSQKGRPKSYVDGEPGLDRARSVDYDTVKQIYSRATAYSATGHVNDKAEAIVLGGTFHSYPKTYRKMFMTLLYKGFNTVHGNRDRPTYSLKREMEINKTSSCRVIGLTIETRPDCITPTNLIELREYGVTRIQLGIQHTNNRVLNRVQRACSALTSIYAIELLKNCGFKVDIHLMPDLPKPFTKDFEEKNIRKLTSHQQVDLTFGKDDIDWKFDMVKEDQYMFDETFHTDRYAPDQVKIYPCEVMDWTGIKDDFERGLHTPYGDIKKDQKTNPLIELLINTKSKIPNSVRINRLIRDIPESYILGGISDMGGRQRIEKMMKDKGLKCGCIRCREIKKKKIDINKTKIRITRYNASGGHEYFLEYITDNNELIGFLRLRISSNTGYHLNRQTPKDGQHNIFDETNIKNKNIVFEELIGRATIRELHVYGDALKVNNNDNKVNSQQHLGFGTRLLHHAFVLADSLGYNKLSVIPGEGVKQYYMKFGFYNGKYFMLKETTKTEIDSLNIKLPVIEIQKQIVMSTYPGSDILDDQSNQTNQINQINNKDNIGMNIWDMTFFAVYMIFMTYIFWSHFIKT